MHRCVLLHSFIILRRHNVSFFRETLPAKTYKLQPVSKDTMLGHAAQSTLQILQGISKGFDFSILDLSAPDAGHMIMIPEVSLEPHLGMSGVDPVDKPGGGEKVEVAVYGTHADFGQPRPHPLVDFISRGMRVHLHDLFQDHLALMRHPVFLI
jgi:hypothetical protein